MQKHNYILNFKEWISRVTGSRHSVVYPYPLFFTPGSAYLYPEAPRVASNKTSLVCGRIPHLLTDTNFEHDYMRYTFILFQVAVDVTGGWDDDWPHIIAAYAYRNNTRSVWNVVICDPNWTPEHHQTPLHLELKRVGERVLLLLNNAEAESDGRVEITKCVGANTCMNVKHGICFAEICAFLVMAAYYRKTQKKPKPCNGEDLVDLMLQASFWYQRNASEVLTSLFQTPYSRSKLKNLMQGGTGGVNLIVDQLAVL